MITLYTLEIFYGAHLRQSVRANHKRVLFLFLSAFVFSIMPAFAEDVKITTYYPSPYGSYKQLQVQNGDESTSITDFTQSLVKSGINIITDYTDTAYTPGIFWSTTAPNDETKPKAGIWMYEASSGTKLLFDTSNDPSVGLHATPGMTIDKDGNVGIGTMSPSQKLAVAGSIGIREGGASPSFHTVIQGGDQSTDITYTLPTTQATAGGTVLTNDGAGALSWAAVSGGGGSAHFAIKSADQSSASTTWVTATWSSGTDLGLVLGANETWEFEFLLLNTSTSGQQINYQLAGPSLTGGWLQAFMWRPELIVDQGGQSIGLSYLPYIMDDYTDENGNYWQLMPISIKGVIRTGSSAGTLRLKFKRASGSGTQQVVLKANSNLKARRIS